MGDNTLAPEKQRSVLPHMWMVFHQNLTHNTKPHNSNRKHQNDQKLIIRLIGLIAMNRNQIRTQEETILSQWGGVFYISS